MVYAPRRVPVIITQEQAFLKAHEQFQILLDFVTQASAEQQRLDQTERGLLSGLLELGGSLLTAFIAGAGNGDRGETTTAPDGSVQRRLPELHSRTYRSIFGSLSITRYVYGTREGQRIACVPLDAQLGLPEGEFSYVLEDWLQRFAVKGSFAEAAQSLQELLGLKPSVRSIEDMNRTMADVAASFIDQRPTPPAREEGELVVLTADGKGVVMRRPAVEGPRQSPTPEIHVIRTQAGNHIAIAENPASITIQTEAASPIPMPMPASPTGPHQTIALDTKGISAMTPTKITLQVSTTSVVIAPDSITLRVGGNTVSIGTSGVDITASGTINIKASGNCTVQASLVQIN